MVLFRVLPIKIVDTFYSVDIVGYTAAYIMRTHLEKVVNTIPYTSLIGCLFDAFVFQETSESLTLFIEYVTCSKHRLVAREICPR